MDWIYLSPHLDDVALSCGGLLWEQNLSGETACIWTICAGDPPGSQISSFAQSLHARWQTGLDAANHRREEDKASCAMLHSPYLHLPFSDCIYRRAGVENDILYTSEEAIFGPIHPLEMPLVDQLSTILIQEVPNEAQIVCPLALGGHVDHRLTRQAAEATARQRNLQIWYYADYPYSLKTGDELAILRKSGWDRVIYPLSESGLSAWQDAIAMHASQISTFWPSLDTMKTAISDYCRANAGIQLWKPPVSKLFSSSLHSN